MDHEFRKRFMDNKPLHSDCDQKGQANGKYPKIYFHRDKKQEDYIQKELKYELHSQKNI